jgi:uncharacterized protein YjbJ (UPF0337 family)
MERMQGANSATTELLAGRWKQLRGELRSWWGRLTEDDLEQIGGQQDKLIGRLQERYGYTRERARQDVERSLQEYHARTGMFSPSTTPPTGSSSPGGTTPPMGTSAVGSSPAKERSEEPSAAASSAAKQATSAVGEQLGSLAGTIRDMAPCEGTAGRGATAVVDTLGAAGSYLQEKNLEHMARDVSDLIRRFPLPSLLIGLGIGYLLARSTRR